MPWGRLDDSFYDHPKIEALGRQANAGAGVHMRAVSWCNRWLTDGRIPAQVLIRKFGAPASLVAAMVAQGLLEVVDADTYLVHDFCVYNDLRDEVEERRRETHEARVRAGQARARSAAREGGRFTSTTSTAPAHQPAEAPAAHQHDAGKPAGDVLASAGHQHTSTRTSTPPAPSESRTRPNLERIPPTPLTRPDALGERSAGSSSATPRRRRGLPRPETEPLAALWDRGIQAPSAGQLRILAEILDRHDVGGAEWTAQIVRDAPGDPLEALMAADAAWQLGRRARAADEEAAWAAEKAADAETAPGVLENWFGATGEAAP